MKTHIRVLLVFVLSAAFGLAPDSRPFAQIDPLVSWK
jgi:hypothetical protein